MPSKLTTHGYKGRYGEIQKLLHMDVKKDMEKLRNSLLQAVDVIASRRGAQAGEERTPATMDYKSGTLYGGKGALKEGIFSLTN